MISAAGGGTGSPAPKMMPGVMVKPGVISIGIVIYLCCPVNKKGPCGPFLVALKSFAVIS
jgi:hypothetical protein